MPPKQAQFNQRNAALEICVRVCLQMPGHNRRRAKAIQDAFYHLRLAVITSNMSIKIAYAMWTKSWTLVGGRLPLACFGCFVNGNQRTETESTSASR